MAEPVEQCELIKAIAFENAFKIEFKVCRSRCSGRVSKQPQGNAIGQNSPRCLLGVVQEVLQHRLRTRSQFRMQTSVKVDLATFYVNGNRVITVAVAMGNRETGIVHDNSTRLEFQI